MGREIRQVPPDWQHPKDYRGRYIPLYDETWEDAMARWVKDTQMAIADYRAWADSGASGEYSGAWGDEMPDPDYYRPDFGDTATAFQIYETVSEGTPVSPVFTSRDDLRDWLIEQGTSPEAAQNFANTGFAFSGAFIPGKGYAANYEAMVLMESDRKGD